MGGFLRMLGGFGKGYATWAGIATVIASQIAGTDAAQKVVEVSETIPQVAMTIGALLATFGIGRKTGFHASR